MENPSLVSTGNEGFSGVISGVLTEVDDVDGELISPEFEDMVEELMRELYEEINTTSPSPLSPAALAGNEKGADGEKYGESVSDLESTVMATVDLAGNVAAGGEVSPPVSSELEFGGKDDV